MDLLLELLLELLVELLVLLLLYYVFRGCAKLYMMRYMQ